MVDAEKWKQIKEIFSQAVELEAAERIALLASYGDETIRKEVEELLIADAENVLSSFSNDISVMAVDLVSGEPTSPSIGRHIGNYKILEQIGRGGMGIVFLAERPDLKQKVALKIIRQEVDSKLLVYRFKREQEILASLEHPNIARLLDIGVTSDSTPFLVLEYVEGQDLLEFCRRRHLSVDDRLILFRKVCAAVSYAHSRLVVHRDLKPSNILVNSAGEPKLLDFGVSKLISSAQTEIEKGTVTSIGMLTPNYAAPEQFRGESVTTSADVYSLSVILYELLTGVLPYQTSNLRFDEIARIICENQPPKPSEAVTGYKLHRWNKLPASTASDNNDHESKENALNANYSPRDLPWRLQTAKLLRGDLDTIILKALRKESTRRYLSVEQFSEDIHRYLRNLPITARPDTVSYRAGKFIKRNFTAVTAGVLLLIALVAGTTATVYEAIHARRQKDLAENRFAQVRELASRDIFKYYDEAEKQPGTTKLREMIATDALKYLDTLAQEVSDIKNEISTAQDHELRIDLAQAYFKLGKVQGKLYDPNLGQGEEAIKSNQKITALLEPLAAANDERALPVLANAYLELGTLLRRKGDIEQATIMFNKSLTINEKSLTLHPESIDRKLMVAQNLIYYGDLAPDEENNPAYEKALGYSEDAWRTNPNDPRVTYFLCGTTGRIADGLMQQAKFAHEVEDFARERRLYEEAAPLYRRSTEIAEKIYSNGDPNNAVNRTVITVARFNESELQRQRGEIQTALNTENETLREYQKIVAADLENQEAKLFLAEMYRGLAETCGRANRQKEFVENFDQALRNLDYLIERQPDNFEFRKKRFDFSNIYADGLLKIGDWKGARFKYDTAFMYIKSGNSDIIEPLRAIYYEKIGNLALEIAIHDFQANLKERRERLNEAGSSYRKTIDILNHLIEGSSTPKNSHFIDKINFLKAKLVEIELDWRR